MSELIIIGYDEPDSARKAYEEVLVLQRDFVVTLNGLAVVTVDEDGKKRVETPNKIVGASAASGAIWGAIVGILFLTPGIGLLFGGAVGALMGKLSKSGVNKDFKARVEGMLQPGKAALVLMASKVTEDKFIAAMKPFGGTVLQTSLSEEDEKELAEELGQTTSA
jgi:uncharacterized membrane protein